MTTQMVNNQVAVIHSVVVPAFSFITLRPTFFIPNVFDVALTPLRMVQWKVDLWPPWSPEIQGTYKTKLESTGFIPVQAAVLDDLITAGEQDIARYSQDDLPTPSEPEISFSIKGIDVIKALISLVFGKELRIRSRATVSWLVFSKNFDIDATIPLP